MTQQTNQDIHAPYHFVPLSKWVYMPDWAHLVSHDFPLKDGLSGVIEYTLTNATPLCVGGEQTKEKGKPALVKWARDPMGNPVIPGSSIKGMVRNVLEIASFAKFNRLDNSQYSYRDISSSKCHYLKDIIAPNDVQAGWIKYNAVSKSWEFTPCQYAKLHHDEANKLPLKQKLRNAPLDPKKEKAQTAQAKYQILPLAKSFNAVISGPRGKQNNYWAEQLNSNSSQGVVGHAVFTHQRIKGQGKPKDYDFSYFFYGRETDNNKYKNIDTLVQRLFENHNPEHVDYLKQHQHPEYGIPVFALIKTQGKKLHSFGFAKMPRVSYNHSLNQCIGTEAQNSEAVFDLSELMMGGLREQGLSLKSRVSFSDATSAMPLLDNLYHSNAIVLNSPKPTFFPAYLEQKNAGKYSDYDDNNATLSGYKRYITKAPQHEKLVAQAVSDKENVSCQLELLKPKQSFIGRVVFHNLTHVELGALLWSLTLGQDKQAYHQLGHGKPFGAGAVQLQPQIKVLRANQPSQDIARDPTPYIQAFIAQMDQAHPATIEGAWQQSPQIKHLLALANLAENQDLDTRYMSIDNKEFQNAKTNRKSLPAFNKLGRQEQATPSFNQPSTAFGQGRLAALLDPESNWEQEQLKQLKALQAEQAEQQAQAQREAELAALPYCQRILAELVQNLNAADNTERAPLLRPVIEEFITQPADKLPESAQELLTIARKNEFHKKPNAKAKAQKAQLEQLKTLYKLD